MKMCVKKFLMSVNLISFLTLALSDQQLSHHNDPELKIVRVPLMKTPFEVGKGIQPVSVAIGKDTTALVPAESKNRERRETTSRQENENSESESTNGNESNLNKDELGWSNINEEVDFVIPMVLSHLEKLQIEHLQLPDMKETISVSPLILTYEAGLFLTNGIVYDIDGVERYGDAFMTYEGKSFLSRFYIILKSLQFEYNFVLKFMALEGSGKIIGSLDDTIIYAELGVDVANITMKLYDFRIIKFSNIMVQLDQMRIIRQLTGVILSPITNLFKDRITTSISDGLKDQMQMIMDDFNDNDPLELRQFAKKLISSLTGQSGMFLF